MSLSDTTQVQRDRLSHIDFRTYFLGGVGRSDLISRFSIGEAAATRDIGLYRELAPQNLEYDTTAKSYVISDEFEPLFNYSPYQVLTALSKGFGENYIGEQRGMIQCETPTELNRPAISTLAVLSRSINLRTAVHIEYRSTSSGFTSREIVPFVLVDNGLRWHVRGFDRKRAAFIDFVITRIANPVMIASHPLQHEKRESDNQWNRIVEMELIAHPNLSHPETIQTDYAMCDGVLKLDVRAAVAGYVLRRWNVDCTEDHSMRGAEYHLWLRNRQALYGVDNLRIAPGYESN